MPSITKRRAKQSKVEYNGKENTMELEKMLVTLAQLSRASPTDKRDTGAFAMILSEQQNDNRAVQQAQSSPPLMCAVMTGPREMRTWQ